MKNIFKGLDYNNLQISKGRIACPFDTLYDGPVEVRNESLCVILCGELFPKLYESGRCPCWSYGNDHKRKLRKAYVRKRFWLKLNKSMSLMFS